MGITDIATSGDTTGATDLAAVRAAHDAGDDARLGSGLYYFPATAWPGSTYGGRTLYLSSGTIISGVFNTGYDANAIYAALNHEGIDGYRVLWEVDDPSVVDLLTGPLVVGNNIYHSVLGGSNWTCRGLRILDASQKVIQTHGGGECLIADIYVASDRGDGTGGSYYPIGLQCDRTDPTPGVRLKIKNVKMGSFARSYGSGPGMKFAGWDRIDIDGVHQIGPLDRVNRATLGLAERLGTVNVKNAHFPGGIDQFPDGIVTGLTQTFSDMVVDEVNLTNVLLGTGEGGILKRAVLWNHYLVGAMTARNVIFDGIVDVAFGAAGSIDHTEVNGESSGSLLEQDSVQSILLEDVCFITYRTSKVLFSSPAEPEIWQANASANRLTGKVIARNVNRIGPNTGGIRWSANTNAATDLAAGVDSTRTARTRREAYLAQIGMNAGWDLLEHTVSDGETLADSEGNTNLTLSTT